MAFPLSLNTSVAFKCLPSFSSSSHGERLLFFCSRNTNPVLPRHSPSRLVLALARRRNQNSAVASDSSDKKKKKKSFARQSTEEEEEDLDDDPFEALFSQLEEDLKNDTGSVDDDDDEINEEDINALARELEEALRDGDGLEMFKLAAESDNDEAPYDDDGDNDAYEDEDDEKPVKLKNWQLRRLAYALKAGRRKTSIKNLAAELCLDRSFVLEMLRDPPPNLVMMSAALPDKPPTTTIPEANPPETISAESVGDTIEPETKKEEPIHVMQQRWSAQKRLKKVQLETLERVYKRSKRPTNAMISSIVQVTNLPRKRVLKWFEDRRTEDGVPDHHRPYRRPVPETIFSKIFVG
ncbi:protein OVEREXPRESSOR OF CATIONIC PEROXIDASE 3 isoform X3 [Carica papaya]|uniref:protein OVEREXPRESSOR OF CATIONIC PEROXIDASE 3 isoform X3 n=1 Tax=Carica papaya TaxID=3649 RepID=UPI000B8CA87B|nr:protein OVEREXPRESSOR OF CATIONIC PEROXIDASE 3 isoform X3 [Carica papaya]